MVPLLDWLPCRTYTVRPWVKVGLPQIPMPFSHTSSLSSSNADFLPPRTESSIRVVNRTETTERKKRSSPRGSLTPTPSLQKSASMSSTSDRRTPRSLFSAREKDQPSPRTPPSGRPRGKTIPSASTESGIRTPERNTDSALSMTPSTSSKHIASWLSGLLGRGS